MIDTSYMSDAERASYLIAASIAQALRWLDIPAEHGPSWGGCDDHRRPGVTTWCVFSRLGGGVLVTCDEHGDCIFVDAADLPGIAERLRLAEVDPPPHDPEARRARVWAIFAPDTGARPARRPDATDRCENSS